MIDDRVFGDIDSFRSQFIAQPREQAFAALRTRLATVCKRTLRRQVTTDTKLTMTTRAKDDPGFVEALLNEAIELAGNGEPELAKRVLRDLIAGTKR